MKDYPVQPVDFTHVRFDDTFWSPKIETNRTVTIPFAFKQCRESKRMYNFERAAAAIRGQRVEDRSHTEFPFDDTDIYKIIEGASYSMAVTPDPKLDDYVDTLIEGIAAAQEPDGYLYTARTLAPDAPHKWAGAERWVLERELSHELYNLGHLYEAAVAHFHATGKRTLLDIAIKTADLLCRTFGPGKESIWPGHQITEMGLVKLYRVTGNEAYLALAKFLLDVRGPDGRPGAGREYNQSHQPVVEQTTAVGHAVRAAYMYAGMADVAAITGDASYLRAIDTIWDNVVRTKLYLTGGIGSTKHGEAFESDYTLPNDTAYCETCAAIANVYWNHRLFLLHADAKYIDVLERSLYNNVLSGVSLDGRSFFYPNVLESDGTHARSPWFGCACCPSNLCRFLASVPGYVYAVQDTRLYANLYATGRAVVSLPSGVSVNIAQATHYPWDGDVRITVDVGTPTHFALKLRIPGWSRGEVVPSDLYAFADASSQQPTLSVNGSPVAIEIDKGYATIDREWTSGDVVELSLPTPARRVTANAKVAPNVGRVAVQRGPIVYCAESADHGGRDVRQLALGTGSALSPETTDTLGGITTITSDSVRLIPYYAWANRGKGTMAVWLAHA